MMRYLKAVCATAGMVVVAAACGRDDAGSTPPTTVISPAGSQLAFMRFSPDGRKVAYFSPGKDGFELVVANADLTAPQTMARVKRATEMFWSPNGARIAYNTDQDQNSNIAIVTVAEGTARRVTQSTSLELVTGWHPNSEGVAFITPIGLITARTASVADGSSTRMVADTVPHLAYWSPDGSRIAYVRLAEGRPTIWLADSLGENRRPLTTEGFESLGGNPWSPDGRALVYVSVRTGTEDVWIVPVDSGEARQLTRDVRRDFVPVWSKDGEWIAFISTRGLQTDVWVVPAAGGDAIRVTDDAVEESNVQWVGESHVVAFTQGRVKTSLWATDVATLAEKQLTPDSLTLREFRPSPVANEVAYIVEQRGGGWELRVHSMETGADRPLVTGSDRLSLPNWSPDGKSVVYSSTRGGSEDVWTISAAGGEAKKITDWPTTERAAFYSRDGRLLYFASSKDAKLSDVWSIPVEGGTPTRLTTGGNLNSGLVESPNGELYFVSIDEGTGRFHVMKRTTGGRMQTLWSRSDALGGISPVGFTAAGDSAALVVAMPGGGNGTYFISTRTGEGRLILGAGEEGPDLTPDGKYVLYHFGAPGRDYGLLNLRDGTKRRLTNTGSGVGYWMTHDAKSLIVWRRRTEEVLATVDLSNVLPKVR